MEVVKFDGLDIANSIVHKEGHIDDDVRNIIVAGLLRSTSGLLCESPDSFSIKGEF